MVCMAGHFKMSSVLKLVMMENHTAPDDVIREMTGAQVLQKQLFDAHEPNLLDENDMHIFGSKPMADPLDLVCCSTCKKPVKASQYAVHTEQCSSGKVNTNDSVGVDYASPTKPLKKGRKIKLISNGNQKVHIKVKAKCQPESKNVANSFELDNGHATKVQSIDFTDAPVPLATKMYHSQGNYRLRMELGQLYRESCVQHLSGHTTQNVSHENGLMASQFSPCGNSALPVSQKSLVPQTKPLASTSESYSGIPQQLAASRPNQSQGTKTERASTQASAVKSEGSRSRGNKAAVPHSRNKGSKKAQQQPNGRVHVM
ncbi:hypothetical protein BDA96_08G130000 [Sorghum bicolor]|nr:uncharacterized protein LOC8067240 [Sorghum bicolor]XP_021302070.1 uncharacterized protein LOC8067240 [Sorghum bicolor]KAG0521079.1 hypothetical protein BDA96_08G130000 [Sorghum bicolor]KAG0521080.1 hypothetical protein BDA96_08G130000 [Sorghum bicolor]|eukprot:XP_002442250.2 uncharacterized protein LOC8067240 [Sorghum bicolor]